jgi:hypothetical protein
MSNRLLQKGSRIFSTAAASRLSFTGAIFAKTGSHCNCVDFNVPVIIRKAFFSYKSILLVCTLFNHTGAQYSAVEWTRANKAVRKVSGLALQFVPANLRTILTRAATFCPVFVKLVLCMYYVKDRSNVTPRYLG